MKTTNPATALDDIMRFVVGYIPRDHDDRPATIKVAPDVYYAIRASAHPLYDHSDRLTGLALRIDDRLPSGVWRALSARDDLIRDSRSENDPNAGRR